MNEQTKTLDWFRTKKATITFAIISLTSGFFFLNQSLTGNVILNNSYSLNFLSIIGLLLIVCAVILAAYSIKKRG
ncbi:MAG: hypothetical protein KKF68_01210 [Nanoarchaeota archaeon]|nr:hypothetical protein [Nanoarchaeota archaeon]